MGTVQSHDRTPNTARSRSPISERTPLLREQVDFESPLQKLQPQVGELPEHQAQANAPAPQTSLLVLAPTPVAEPKKHPQPPQFTRDFFGNAQIELPSLESPPTRELATGFRRKFFEAKPTALNQKDSDFNPPSYPAGDDVVRFANEYLRWITLCGIDSASLCEAVQLSCQKTPPVMEQKPGLALHYGTGVREFIADCIQSRKAIVQEADMQKQAADHADLVVLSLEAFIEQVPTDWDPWTIYPKKYLKQYQRGVADILDFYWFSTMDFQVDLRFGVKRTPEQIKKLKKHNDPIVREDRALRWKLIAFLWLLHSVALEYLQILRTGPQPHHAILSAKAAVAVDAANRKYYPDEPRISVDDILMRLERHGREAIDHGRVDDLKQCEEAIRSLAQIAPEQAQSCLDALRIG
jgi:hypothetical protein